MLLYARHLGCDAAGRRDLVRLGLADGEDVVDHAAVAERPIEDAFVACSAEGRRRVCVLGGRGELKIHVFKNGHALCRGM
jgi:hypothetical protein